jgi:hypothetical protein
MSTARHSMGEGIDGLFAREVCKIVRSRVGEA